MPTAASPLGLALSARIQALQATLAGTLGVPGFTTAPALPVARASQDQLTSYLTSTSGPIAGQLEDRPLSQRGDAEFGGVWTLIDRWNDDARGTGLRLAVTGLYRLGTGFPERADRFLDLGTGTGHSAFGGTVTADLGLGRFGARLTGGYLRQLAANDQLRVTGPGQPYAPFNRIRTLRVDPGDILAFGGHPFVRLVPGFAIQAGLDHWRQTAEQVSYLSRGRLDSRRPGLAALRRLEDRGHDLLGRDHLCPAGGGQAGRDRPATGCSLDGRAGYRGQRRPGPQDADDPGRREGLFPHLSMTQACDSLGTGRGEIPADGAVEAPGELWALLTYITAR